MAAEALLPPRSRPQIDFPIKSSRQFSGIVWHHSKLDNGEVQDWDSLCELHTSHRVNGRAVTEAEYRKAFIQQRGAKFEQPMDTIGYHLGVEFADVGNGVYAPALRVGRALNRIGAHLPDLTGNHEYLGFIAIGDFDYMPMRPEMYDMCLRVTRRFLSYYGLRADAVLGHGEWLAQNKKDSACSCPGALWSLEKFRRDL